MACTYETYAKKHQITKTHRDDGGVNFTASSATALEVAMDNEFNSEFYSSCFKCVNGVWQGTAHPVSKLDAEFWGHFTQAQEF